MKHQGSYKNGQKISEQKGDILTYYYDNGIVRAKGKMARGMMQGKWTFNRKDGQLWVIGHFKDDKKHGLWLRYDRKGELEKRETFIEGKVVKEGKVGKVTREPKGVESQKAKTIKRTKKTKKARKPTKSKKAKKKVR